MENEVTVSKMAATQEEIKQILEKIPQQKPFRFIEKILELDDNHILSSYRYKKDEYFYEGHFPGNPVTPGVIMIETMAQAGLVALGIYLLMKEGIVSDALMLFSDCEIEFSNMIKPEEQITVYAEKIFFRRGKLKAKVEIRKENGVIAAEGVMSGVLQ
ncbi:MAG: beta-hydroxyacyl-ACP dehydratase [Spirochaetia bacterium]|nr:beta-hydroxyacyl-ACP dehydratase [Spirochaetia bacterium]